MVINLGGGLRVGTVGDGQEEHHPQIPECVKQGLVGDGKKDRCLEVY